VALRSPAPPLLVKAAAFLIPAAILLGVAVPRLGVEWEWFGQFGFESVVLRRWLLQLTAFLVVMGLGIPLQLQQLQRCWNLRQRAGSKILPPDSLFRLNPGPLVAVQAVLLILLTWPLLHAMHSTDSTVVLLAQCGFAFLVGPLLGTMPALLVEAFPRDLRCSAASVAYNLSMAVFGGLSPMVATWLISRTQKDMAPAYLVIGAAVVALIAVLTLRETARRPLR
jgi:steroid 5-alpha reductase family enzyme